jgi:transcriptional regulator GlxA family with amidase domain
VVNKQRREIAIRLALGAQRGDILKMVLRRGLGLPRVALAVARELVVYMKRPGGQEQFSEPLKFQVVSTSRFADLAAWMLGHLDQDLSVAAMAEQMNLCPRQFSRRFRMEFNSSPAAFVQRVRLDEARNRLSAPGCTVERVADSVGFHDPDSFRRAFMQRFGVAPSHYRGRFLAGADG